MTKDDRINVLVIHADQHRADCIGVYGNKEIKTPEIDSLASDGITFKNNFCTFPACTPSRYSLLTGLYVHQHLGWSNHCTLPAGLPTFPKILQANGYRTKCVGKMHFTPTYADLGFDEMILAEQDGPGRFDDDYHRWLRDKGLVDAQDTLDQIGEIRKEAYPDYWENHGADVSDLNNAFYSTTWIGDRAVEEISEWTGGGHCMMVGFIKPHHPHDVPEPWASLYDPDELTLLNGWTDNVLERDYNFNRGYFDQKTLDENKIKKIMAQYYASISQIDHHVGRMVETLRQNGQYDNTLIIYTSDHGDYMGYHHMCLKSNYMYDPVARVPCIVKFPGSRDAGAVSDGLTSIVDLTTTILNEAQCAVPRVMQGLNMDAELSRDAVYCEVGEGSSYMVRTRTHKLILCRDDEKSVLIDLEKDPLEMENLVSDPSYSDVLSDLKAKLFNWLAFDTVPRNHVDENGPIASCHNARRLNEQQRDDMRDYIYSGTHNYIDKRKSQHTI